MFMLIIVFLLMPVAHINTSIGDPNEIRRQVEKPDIEDQLFQNENESDESDSESEGVDIEITPGGTIYDREILYTDDEFSPLPPAAATTPQRHVADVPTTPMRSPEYQRIRDFDQWLQELRTLGILAAPMSDVPGASPIRGISSPSTPRTALTPVSSSIQTPPLAGFKRERRPEALPQEDQEARRARIRRMNEAIWGISGRSLSEHSDYHQPQRRYDDPDNNNDGGGRQEPLSIR